MTATYDGLGWVPPNNNFQMGIINYIPENLEAVCQLSNYKPYFIDFLGVIFFFRKNVFAMIDDTIYVNDVEVPIINHYS